MVKNNKLHHLWTLDQEQNVWHFFTKTTSNKINDKIKSVLFQKKDSQSIATYIRTQNKEKHHISINKKVMMTLSSEQKVDILTMLLKEDSDILSIDYIYKLNEYELCLFITQLPYQNDLQNACIIKDILVHAIYNPWISMKNKNTFIQLLQWKIIDLWTLVLFKWLITVKEKVELIETFAWITHCIQFNNYEAIFSDACEQERYNMMISIIKKMKAVSNFDTIMFPHNFTISDPVLINQYFQIVVTKNNRIKWNKDELIKLLNELYENTNTKRMLDIISYELWSQNLTVSWLLQYLDAAKKQSET
jgi:hypothetical protein